MRRPFVRNLLAVTAAVAAVGTTLAAGPTLDLPIGAADETAASHRNHVHKEESTERSAIVDAFVAANGSTAQAAAGDAILSDVPCTDGMAGPFPCQNMDLLAFVPYQYFSNGDAGALGEKLSEAWGWFDSATGREYALVGNTGSVAIFDITVGTDPVYLGEILSHAPAQLFWFDVKVIGNAAFITSESAPFGMQVFDLTRLRGANSSQDWYPDAIYAPNLAAHNVAVNPKTNTAFLVGSGTIGSALISSAGVPAGTEVCMGGIHAVNVANPLVPVFKGCFALDGYTHDVQCVTYDGPDADYSGREICFAYNEDTVTIVDFSAVPPTEISRLTYEDVAYTHQGWLTEDGRYLLMNDELDEQSRRVAPEGIDGREDGPRTRTLVVDVADLDAPELVGPYFHDTMSIDHNNYVRNGLAYQSNYTSGLRVLDLDGIATAELETIAYFDTFPDHDDTVFAGTWGNYPYYPSGNVVISSGTEGLFVVRLHDDVRAAFEGDNAPNAMSFLRGRR